MCTTCFGTWNAIKQNSAKRILKGTPLVLMTSLLAASQFHCSTFAIYLFFSVRKRIFRFVPNGLVPRHHIIDSSEFSGISTFYAFGSWKEIGLSKAGSFTDSHRAIVSHAALVDLSSVWEKFVWGLRLRGLNVAEDVQPSVKEHVEVYIDNLMDTYMCFQEFSLAFSVGAPIKTQVLRNIAQYITL